MWLCDSAVHGRVAVWPVFLWSRNCVSVGLLRCFVVVWSRGCVALQSCNGAVATDVLLCVERSSGCIAAPSCGCVVSRSGADVLTTFNDPNLARQPEQHVFALQKTQPVRKPRVVTDVGVVRDAIPRNEDDVGEVDVRQGQEGVDEGQPLMHGAREFGGAWRLGQGKHALGMRGITNMAPESATSYTGPMHRGGWRQIRSARKWWGGVGGLGGFRRKVFALFVHRPVEKIV